MGSTMGNMCMSSEQKASIERDKAIDRELKAEEKVLKRTIKLLLLGAGESGKSTLVKQMKIIHGDGYTSAELKGYTATIRDNVVQSMGAIITSMGTTLKINLGDQSNRVNVKEVLVYLKKQEREWTAALGEAVRKLWMDSGVQQAYGRANEFQLNDSAVYYFEAIDRIQEYDYVPTEQDVLRARVRTTGVIETSFKFKDYIFKMIDVGGQRAERKKWIGSFFECKAVIFVSALSGYDLKLEEDEDVNRVHESMTLFEAICNNKFFLKTSMILFMNKTDLFEQKIMKSDLKKFFPDYTGREQNPDAAMAFLKSKFLALNKNSDKKIYTHYTCATDTSSIEKVFNTVSDIIIDTFFGEIGFN